MSPFETWSEMGANLSNNKWDNVNSTKLHIFAFSIANCTLLLFTMFVGIAANLFVIWAVCNTRSLQTSNNALIVNLAVIDLLRCTIDCPLLIATDVKAAGGNVDMGRILCQAQTMSFCFSCCVQLLTLASISAERYLAISHPFQTSQRRRRITVVIPLTWMLSMLVSVLCVRLITDAPVYIKCRGMTLDHLPTFDSFGIYILVPVWFGCLAVITGFYGRIFFIVRAHSRKIFDAGGFPPPKKTENGDESGEKKKADSKSTQSEREEKKTEEQTGSTTVLPADAGSVTDVETEKRASPSDGALSADIQKAESERVSSQGNQTTAVTTIPTEEEQPATPRNSVPIKKSVSFAPEINLPPPEEVPVLVDLEENSTPDTKLEGDNNVIEISPLSVEEAQPTEPLPEAPTSAKESEEVAGAVCMMPSFAHRERVHKNKEGKLAKRSGYIILTFLLFWTPLIASVLVNIFVHNQKHPNMYTALELEILSISLACMTSATNPVTYAVVNPQFRTEFWNLKARCKATFCEKTFTRHPR